ncbi:pentapeptide repeat protein [Nocardioides albertanoniae]|uniref:Pentapeptide repeat protein n=1 Tax=Nocardioides albertanoniae TaxID=1175486 RepID=A0A543ACC4_9ACTN|nr:pentapeptide repeat-containing protein [Nocardioides albertanoniae]TQL70228.1 pentapeptide repeat protein [Nocardioides albertanoniae]
MGSRTHVELGRRADLGADCSSCFGLCCVALAFVKSTDFPHDKPAGEPCENLDGDDACSIHSHLRDRGFKGCTVFDCFGAGQKVSQHTFAGRSWRDDPQVGAEMFAAFPVVRRLHELLWYLGEAIELVRAGDRTGHDPTPWVDAFDEVRRLTDLAPQDLVDLDVDAAYDSARDLLLEASEIARSDARPGSGRVPEPGSDLIGANLAGSDLTGATLRGSVAIAADLSGARLRRCDVLGVDLRDADLSGADLSSAIYLTEMQVNSARGDARTALPQGFDRPSHWTP